MSNTPVAAPAAEDAASADLSCAKCGIGIDAADYQENLHVCPSCQWHAPLTANEWIAHLADPESFKEIGRRLFSADPLKFRDPKPYRAASRSGAAHRYA